MRATYRWLPNDGFTRLHAVVVGTCSAHPGEPCGPAECRADVALGAVVEAHYDLPKCFTCRAALGEGRPFPRPPVRSSAALCRRALIEGVE